MCSNDIYSGGTGLAGTIGEAKDRGCGGCVSHCKSSQTAEAWNGTDSGESLTTHS